MESVESRLARYHKRLIAAGFTRDDIASLEEPAMVPACTLDEAVSHVRRSYAVYFPDVEAKLDPEKLATSIRAWRNTRGRPKSDANSTPKFEAIADLMRSAGIPASTQTIKREWLHYVSERKARQRSLSPRPTPPK